MNSITVKKYELLRLASFNTAGLQQSKKNVRVGWSESARALALSDQPTLTFFLDCCSPAVLKLARRRSSYFFTVIEFIFRNNKKMEDTSILI